MGLISVGSGGCWLAGTTVIFADAVAPSPASVEVTTPVTLFCVPRALPVTSTVKLQDAPALSAAPARLTLVAPAVAVIVPLPQDPVSSLGVDTANPLGKLSVNPIPLRAELLFGLVRVNVSVVFPPRFTPAEPNAFEIVGGNFAGGGVVVAELPPQLLTIRIPGKISHSSQRAVKRDAAIMLDPYSLLRSSRSCSAPAARSSRPYCSSPDSPTPSSRYWLLICL